MEHMREKVSVSALAALELVDLKNKSKFEINV